MRTRRPIVEAPLVSPAETAPRDGLLGLAIGVVIVSALYVAHDVFVPITLAVLLSFVLAPVVGFFRRRGLWRAPSVLLAVLMALAALGAVGALVGTQAASLSSDAPQYAQRIQHKVEATKAYVAEHTAIFAGRPAQRGGQPSATGPGAFPSIPPPWQDAGSGLCIAGKGPLDDVATAMLAQLLNKRGVGIRRIAHEHLPRQALDALDVSQTEMICISYLQTGKSTAHLRSLIRRLRRRAPSAGLVVGLWAEGKAALSDTTGQHAADLTIYVSKLSEAIAACLRPSTDLR